ncbi:hypothetical protein SBRCBS47491_006972 [Sporothrix bragantina]|uniref:Carboxylesterase type B domain-containing protein n=1 Tax=Sporothrix bragantina TaxID=671064 RepID=A0ABP0CAI6_9PEZI
MPPLKISHLKRIVLSFHSPRTPHSGTPRPCCCPSRSARASLVRRSLDIGSPVIVVTINYRLGVLGFLHSKELAASEADNNGVPPEFRSTANLDLVDCKYAFDWLRWDDITITRDPREAVFDSTRWNPSLQAMVLGTCQKEPWIREAAILLSGKSHDITKVIQSRIPAHADLRERAAQLYAKSAAFPWHAASPALNVPDRNHCSMSLEGHCRYYTPAALFSQSLAKRSAPAQLYRYVFGYATVPVFLHSGLTEKDRRVSETFADRLIAFTVGSAPTNWTPYTADEAQSNVFDKDGSWSVGSKKKGAFDLTEEVVQFWGEVVKAILATGRTGWAEMAR